MVNDPRSPASLNDIKAQHEIQMKLYAAAKESWNRFHEVGKMRIDVAAILDAEPADEVQKRPLISMQSSWPFKGGWDLAGVVLAAFAEEAARGRPLLQESTEAWGR